MQTVRVWDRRNGRCKAVLKVGGVPLTVSLLSDDLTVVTCDKTCSVWKGAKCLRRITANDKRPVCATAIQDNMLFMANKGEDPPCCMASTHTTPIA